MYNRVFNGDDMVYMTLLFGTCGIFYGFAAAVRVVREQVLEVSPQRWLVV